MPRTAKEMWQNYHDEALVFTQGSFEYTVADIRDDFYAGLVCGVETIAEAQGGGSQATLDTITALLTELKEYWDNE